MNFSSLYLVTSVPQTSSKSIKFSLVACGLIIFSNTATILWQRKECILILNILIMHLFKFTLIFNVHTAFVTKALIYLQKFWTTKIPLFSLLTSIAVVLNHDCGLIEDSLWLIFIAL